MENMYEFVLRDSSSGSMDVPECQQKCSQNNLDCNNLATMDNIIDAEEPGFSELQEALQNFPPIYDLAELEEVLANLHQPSECSLADQNDRSTNTNTTVEKNLDNIQFVETGSNNIDPHFDMDEFLKCKTNRHDNSQFIQTGSDDFAMDEFLQVQTHNQDENALPSQKQTETTQLNMRRKRTSFNGDQILELEKEFKLNPRINRIKRIQMAESLGLSERQIKTWFQNRRTKEKKELNTRIVAKIPEQQVLITRAPPTSSMSSYSYETIPSLDPEYHNSRYTSMPRYTPYGF